MFGAVLLVGSGMARHLSRRETLLCAGAAAAGALVPVAVVVAWSLAAGVRLQTLWFAAVSFRSDANRVIAGQSAEGATSRISVLLLVFVGVGMLFLLVCFAARLPALLRTDAVPVVAITAMLAVDLVGVAVSGSYWTPYLFVPIPGLALALAALMAHGHLDRRWHLVTPTVVVFVVASSVFALAGWTGSWVVGRVPVEVRTGQAIAAAGRPGDRVLVYGGRADIQWASGAPSPYRHLWSELGTRPIERSLIRKYQFVRTACGRYRIYHLNSVEPIDVDVDCTTPYRTIWGR